MAKAKKAAWYKTGEAGVKASKQADVQAKARRESRGPRRFHLPNDDSAKISFLDTPQFFLWEHNLNLGGKWFNYFTCLKDFDTCPLCESGDNASYILAGTVVNHKPYTDKDGAKHVNQKELFVAKGKARQSLLRQIERREGDLAGCVYEMARGSSTTECATGEDFDYLGKKLTKKQMKAFIPKDADEKWLEPFDYEKIFEPKDPAELRKLIGGAPPVGADDDDEQSKKDVDDVLPDETEAEEEAVSSIEDLL